MSDSTIIYLILGVVVGLFVSNRVPVAVVAIGTALSLWATGVLDLAEATAGFGEPTVLLIASVFVVAEALDATGVTAWVGETLVDRAGADRSRILVAMMLTCAVLTAFVTPHASVAALVPVVVIIAVRVGQPTSQLLIPLAFASHAGALLTLTGSPVSVIVSDAADRAGAGRFGFFEFALTGIPLLIGTLAIVLLLGPRLLPYRSPASTPRDFSELDTALRRHYRIDGEDGARLLNRRYGASEVMIPPRSPLIGRPARPGMVAESGELVIVAVTRGGVRLDDADTVLAAGDVLLVRGTWQALSRKIGADEGVRVVDPPDLVRRHAVPIGIGATEAIVVLAVMVVLLATDLVPPAVATLGAACALVLLSVVSVEEAFASINWTNVVLIAGMLPLSTAMRTSGAAETLADGVIDLVGDAGPIPLLIALFVLSAVLGQLISNVATAVVVIPIALSAAAELDVSARPVLMSLNVVCAASLLTPVATPPNLMVMEPGGYRFGDYWKLGLVLMAWYFVVSVLLVPLIWPL